MAHLITHCNTFYLDLLRFMSTKDVSGYELSLWYTLNGSIQFFSVKPVIDQKTKRLSNSGTVYMFHGVENVLFFRWASII